MRHLWRHLAFSGLCNIVVCTTYDFLKKTAITQKFKMADLDSFHNLKWLYILHCLSKGLYSININSYEIEDEKCRMCTLAFPVSAI